MALNIIIGGAGAGKSTLLRRHMIESALENPNTTHLMLVPEQFTMQTQRDIIEAHPRHASLNIDVLSFERLAYRITEERADVSFNILTDMGKQMLLRKASEENRGGLTVFNGSIRRTGFLRSLSEMISELYQYGVNEERLDGIRESLSAHPLLKRKLDDIKLIRNSFEKRRSSDSIVAEELLPSVLKVLPETNFAAGAKLYIDGFTGFTPVQLKILEILICRAADTEITILLPEEELGPDDVRPGDLFSLGKTTLKALTKAAGDCGIPCRRTIMEGDRRHSKVPELAFLSKYFLRFGKNAVYEEECTAVTVRQLRNEAAEAAYAAGVICDLVRNKGYRYRDIAVVTGDAETYRRFLVAAFEKQEIPYYCDMKKGLAGDPLAEYILGALDIPASDFSYESVMRFVRCAAGPFVPDEADLLDSYLFTSGIRGKGIFSKEFEWCPDRRLEPYMADIEKVRGSFLKELAPVMHLSGTGKHTGAEWTAALRTMLTENDVPARMNMLSEEAAAAGDSLRAEEYSRIPEFMEDLFTEIDSLFGNEAFGTEDFAKILEAGISEGRLGMLPRGLDLIQIGDLKRSRQTKIRALILLGMNDGLIPAKLSGGGILTERERSVLNGYGIELAPAAYDAACEERAYLYMLLTRPEEKLIVTYHTQDAAGASARPSYLLSRLTSLYKQLAIGTEEDISLPEKLPGKQAVREEFALNVLKKTAEQENGREDMAFHTLAEYLYREDREAFERILAMAFSLNAENGITEETAGRLYGDEIRLSVTRLESFANCAAAHFLNYGLRLKERRPYEVDTLDKGSFFHAVLDQFFKLLKKNGLTIQGLDPETAGLITQQAVDLALRDEKMMKYMTQSAEGAYRTGRFKDSLVKGITAVCSLMQKGDFEQEESEMVFSGHTEPALTFTAENGTRMVLEGKIDRVDVYEKDGKRYLRVVDYKTGEKSFSLEEVYAGRSMQLVLYLMAALMRQKKQYPDREAVPAGMYYFSFADKPVDLKDAGDAENIDEKWIDSRKMTGLSNSDQLLGEHSEKRKGGAADIAQFGALFAHTEHKMKEFADRIAGGEAEPSPVKTKKGSSCDYCPYASVCGFDTRLPAYDYTRTPERKDDDIWEDIMKESGNGSELD